MQLRLRRRRHPKPKQSRQCREPSVSSTPIDLSFRRNYFPPLLCVCQKFIFRRLHLNTANFGLLLVFQNLDVLFKAFEVEVALRFGAVLFPSAL